MKKIAMKGILAIAVAIAITACDEKFQTLTSNNYGIRFPTDNSTVTEGRTTNVLIPVTLAAPAQGSAIDVTYEVTGEAVEGSDYTFVSPKGTVTIPAGAFSANIELKILDDRLLEPAKALTFKLTSTSNAAIPAGLGNTTTGKFYYLTVSDNDCAYADALFVGAFKGREVYASSCYPAGCVGTYAVTLAKTGATTITVTNFWNDAMTLNLTIDPVTLSITVPQQTPKAGVTVRGVGVGTLTPCTRQLVFRTYVNYLGDESENDNIYIP